MSAIRITRQDLTQKVQEGWKKDQLAEHYGLPVAQVTKLLGEAGLRIRKFHKPKYELVDEPLEEQEVVDINVQAEEVAVEETPVSETSTSEDTLEQAFLAEDTVESAIEQATETTSQPEGW